MESGIYIRVGTENLLLEEMTAEQRQEWLNKFDVEGLIRTINILCNSLNNGKKFLEMEGYVKDVCDLDIDQSLYKVENYEIEETSYNNYLQLQNNKYKVVDEFGNILK